MPMPEPTHQQLSNQKLFAAIFLDGEIGGGPLNGLNFTTVTDAFIRFLNDPTNQQKATSYNEKIKNELLKHLKQIDSITRYSLSNTPEATAQHITEIFENEQQVVFPGGWAGRPVGHALLYQLFINTESEVVFLAYNTGAGIKQYHKHAVSDELNSSNQAKYLEKFNPVYAVRFPDKNKLTEFGGLRAWIKNLIEPQILPIDDPSYILNDAKSLYEKIIQAHAYLGGEVVDPTPFYPYLTSGQRGDTCALQVLKKFLRPQFTTDVAFSRFFLDFRLFMLEDNLINAKLPDSFGEHFAAALENTARMLKKGKSLTVHLNSQAQQIIVQKLQTLQQQATGYFKRPSPPLSDTTDAQPEATITLTTTPLPEGDLDIPTPSSIAETQTSLILFDKTTHSLIDALKTLKEECKKPDKRRFIYNIEQLCFIYCEQITNQENQADSYTKDDWASAISLLHLYSLEYFTFFFNNKDWYSEIYNIFFKEKTNSSIRSSRTGFISSSSRNKAITLSMMTLTHYLAMQYYSFYLDPTNPSTKSHIDEYLAYMPSWLIFKKMANSVLLSSVDPKINHLFLCLEQYFSKYKKLRVIPHQEMGAKLLEHFKYVMNSPLLADDKTALEEAFQNDVKEDRRLQINDERQAKLVQQDNLQALYYAFYIHEHPNARSMRNIRNIQHQIDICISCCVGVLMYGDSASIPQKGSYISICNEREQPFLYIQNCMTSRVTGKKLYSIPEERDEETWQDAINHDLRNIRKIAQGEGYEKFFDYWMNEALLQDSLKKHPTSNQICLDKQRSLTIAQLRDLRTSSTLQTVEIIDYMTSNIDKLAQRDYQFYTLLSLFQPPALELALVHKAQVCTAMKELYKKSLLLGDLTQDKQTLTYRGLFILRLCAFMYSYIIKSAAASVDEKQKAYQLLSTIYTDLEYWLKHDQRITIQTELQRLRFYTLMHLYTTNQLSEAEYQQQLTETIYSRLHMAKYANERLKGTITEAEDESFDELILKMDRISLDAIYRCMPSVLAMFLPMQAPFLYSADDECNSICPTLIDSDQQCLTVNLLTGEILQDNQKLFKLPTTLTQNHHAFAKLFGDNNSIIARKLGDNIYEFNWSGNIYRITKHTLHKQINQEWYSYENNTCLPEYLREKDQYAWVNLAADYALIYPNHITNEPCYIWKSNALICTASNGQICLDGEARQAIVATFRNFEDPSLIKVTKSNTCEDTQYTFELTRYQLQGSYSANSGLRLQLADKLFSISRHPSPLNVGIMLSERQDASSKECELLVPIQAFYTKEEQFAGRYLLVHDIDRQTMPVKLFSRQAYAHYQQNTFGELSAKNPLSSDTLYLAYLHCARYEYRQAFNILKHYNLKSTAQDRQLVYWLCKKLPAILEKQGDMVKPICNTALLAIKLKALIKFIHSFNNHATILTSDSEESEFWQNLPEYIRETYQLYYDACGNLSEELQIPDLDIDHLTKYVWLGFERKANALRQKLKELDAEDEDDKNSQEIAKLEKSLQKCVNQQLSGYLAYAYAKTAFTIKPQRNQSRPFIHGTTVYNQASIQQFFPDGFLPQDYGYVILPYPKDKSQLIPGKFYIAEIDFMLQYTYVNASGKYNEGYIYLSFGDYEINKSSIISDSMKTQIIEDARKQGFIASSIPELSTLQALINNPQIEQLTTTTCSELTLNISDAHLTAMLPILFRLIADENTDNDANRKLLHEFCKRTIIACHELNESLKDPLDNEAASDPRTYRLKITSLLLAALENPRLFRDAYTKVLNRTNKQQNQPVWIIISDKNHGFYRQLKENSHNLPEIEHKVSTSSLNIIQLDAPVCAAVPIAQTHKPSQNKQDRITVVPSGLCNVLKNLQTISTQHAKDRAAILDEFRKFNKIQQLANFTETDGQLDNLNNSYLEKVVNTIDKELDIQTAKPTLISSLLNLSESLVASYQSLKRTASMLPDDLQLLLEINIRELGKTQLPLAIEQLLDAYARQQDTAFLEQRLVAKLRPNVQKAIHEHLHNLFLYKQYQRILETLKDHQQARKPSDKYAQTIKLAQQMLELSPIDGNSALDIFQARTGKTVRGPQWDLVSHLIADLDPSIKARVGQMMMGGGKTKVILPLLAFLKADGHHLATIFALPALLQTTFEDLQQTAKEVFNQELVLFPFDRNSACDELSLTGYLSLLEDAIKQKKCLVLAPSSLQSLHLKWRELYVAALTQPENTELLRQIDLLNDILGIFKERADGVADEIHKILDINEELNYSINEQTALDPLISLETLKIYEFLEDLQIQEDLDQPLAALNGVSFTDILSNPEILHHPVELLPALMAYYEAKYLEAQPIDSQPSQAKMRALRNAQWEIFLPLTLKQKLNEQYGDSPDLNTLIAVPYEANNVATHNYFANFLESINYTIQMVKLEGTQLNTFVDVFKSWKKVDQQFAISTHTGISEAERNYQACLQSIPNNSNLPQSLREIDVSNIDALKELYPHFYRNRKFVNFALADFILPSIKHYKHKLASNAINLVNLVKRFQGLSGTPENYPTYHDNINFDISKSFGTKQRLKSLLREKNTQLLVQGEEEVRQLSAIIDIGAHKLGQTNLEVAQELAANVQDTAIAYILFFHNDKLCAWKVGGNQRDIVQLNSTNQEVIQKSLKVGPEKCFFYYDQNHATGIDLVQSASACAAVSVDVSTTLTSFLQAVARMRGLSAGQSVKIVLSEALKAKLGDDACLDDLYVCLEETEKKKIAADVFKAACKKLHAVVQNDLDKRLMSVKAEDGVQLFAAFQDLLVEKNSDDIIELYGKNIQESATTKILSQIRDSILLEWQNATSSTSIDSDLEIQCNAIISKALLFCEATQKTNLELGTQVSIEQHQQVQIELKTQTKLAVDIPKLEKRRINLKWAATVDFTEHGSFTNPQDAKWATLTSLWHSNPYYQEQYPEMNWSDKLLVSKQFYMTYKHQASGMLDTKCPLKSPLATLFWQESGPIHALLLCQEEAEMFAKRITDQKTFSHIPQHLWLESMNGLSLAGDRPEDIGQNLEYRSLKEQIYTLDGEAPLLSLQEELHWFTDRHITVLQTQMGLQNKQDYSVALRQLTKRFDYDTSAEEEPAAKNEVSSDGEELDISLEAEAISLPDISTDAAGIEVNSQSINNPQTSMKEDFELQHSQKTTSELKTRLELEPIATQSSANLNLRICSGVALGLGITALALAVVCLSIASAGIIPAVITGITGIGLLSVGIFGLRHTSRTNDVLVIDTNTKNLT